MTHLLFYSEENGLVIVCPPVDPEEGEFGGTFWPVCDGGGFCGVSHAELRAAGKGTLDIDQHGRARIGR